MSDEKKKVAFKNQDKQVYWILIEQNHILGQGAFGQVCFARHEQNLTDVCAVKMIPNEKAS